MLGIYLDIYTTFRLIARANSPDLLFLFLLLHHHHHRRHLRRFLLTKEVNAVIITIIRGKSSQLLTRYNFGK